MVAKKKHTGLGKGLEALFGDIEAIEKSKGEEAYQEGVDLLDIDKIKPNKGQPRKTFDKEALEDLAKSIEEHGIIQPVIVRPSDKGFEIVAGERRYRAARQVGLKEIPCIVRELTDEENMLFAIIENMQREDLNPVEEAEGLATMISTHGLTQEQVAKSVGKSRPYVANSLRLLKLPEEIRAMLNEGKLSSGHGRTLITVSDKKEQIKLAKKAFVEDWSVRSLESAVNGKTPSKRKKPRPRTKHPDILQVEENLKNILGTKVNLNQSGKKGKIEIEYYSREELDRLIDILETI